MPRPPSYLDLFLMIRRPPRSPLFPDTTLFRSVPFGPDHQRVDRFGFADARQWRHELHHGCPRWPPEVLPCQDLALIHAKLRFPLNNGQTNAVKTKLGLGGEPEG